LYAFVLGRGLVKASEDDSADWVVLSNDFEEAIPLHIAADEKDAQHLALTTQSNGVLESRDGGRTWRPFGKGGA
jgi:hypothetical protein